MAAARPVSAVRFAVSPDWVVEQAESRKVEARIIEKMAAVAFFVTMECI
jgi:hypothetical protein